MSKRTAAKGRSKGAGVGVVTAPSLA